MNTAKRNKRKAEKERRFQALASRHTAPTATVTSYGNAHVEYLGVVVHRGSTVIAKTVVQPRDYQSLQETVKAAISFAASYQVAKVYGVDEVQPPVYDMDGQPLLNIADRLPQDLN